MKKVWKNKKKKENNTQKTFNITEQDNETSFRDSSILLWLMLKKNDWMQKTVVSASVWITSVFLFPFLYAD